MASNRLRRVAKELSDIQADTESKIFCEPANGSELTHLRASFPGPPDTPYEGGTYIVDVKIPNEYPFRPPVMYFTTKLWHPNVSSQTVSCIVRFFLAVRQMLKLQRERFVLTPLARLGRRFSLSSLPSYPSNHSSAHPSPKTHKMQR
jgi:ubiquitin-protein ligase